MVHHGVHTQVFHDAIEVISFLRKEVENHKVSSERLFNQVINHLPEIADPQDKVMVETEIRFLLSKGWDVLDIINYISSMNEVNPFLDEDIAISRMKEIRDKYDFHPYQTWVWI